MDHPVTPCLPGQSRKRQRDPEKWTVNIEKRARYSSKGLPERPVCQHNTKAFKCGTLSMADIKYFHNIFYKKPEKITQDAFLLKYCKPKQIKRRRGQQNSNRRKLLQTKFKVFCFSQKCIVPVCQKAFLNILQITKHRVQTIMKHFFKTGSLVTERRGGNRKELPFREKVAAVKGFICSFNCDEPHYCRGTTQRFYLAAELNINKMWRMYNTQAQNNLKVKKEYFRKIFNTYFNLGFGSPRTDVCSTCLQHDELLKVEKDTSKRNAIMIEKRVHKLRAKAFFDLVREEKADMMTFCFDCQKNCPMPKLPDQSTYYSRQLYLYNCTVIQGNSKTKLSKENTFAYCWTEDTFAKGSNEIASIVFHRLCSTDFVGIKTVRLIADGCGGQNKNSSMVTMIAKWLTNYAPETVKVVEIVFPIVGHSFIPPDRVFGMIEKDLRKQEIIKNPEEYLKMIENYSTVIKLGVDFKVYDWRSAMKACVKDVGQWHFQFQKSKRFFIKRTKSKVDVVVKGDLFYKTSDGMYRGITKKNKNFHTMTVGEIISSGRVNANKLTDVKNLIIKHYGDNWTEDEELMFYKSLVETEDTDVDEVLCESQNEEPILRI